MKQSAGKSAGALFFCIVFRERWVKQPVLHRPDSIRRQSIVFQGVQSKLSYVLDIVMNVVRFTLVVVGVVLLYT